MPELLPHFRTPELLNHKLKLELQLDSVLASDYGPPTSIILCAFVPLCLFSSLLINRASEHRTPDAAGFDLVAHQHIHHILSADFQFVRWDIDDERRIV